MSDVDLPLDEQIAKLREVLAGVPTGATVKRRAIEQRLATLISFATLHNETLQRGLDEQAAEAAHSSSPPEFLSQRFPRPTRFMDIPEPEPAPSSGTRQDTNRVINAHLLAAERALERGDEKKAENNLNSATQLSEMCAIPHFGRYNLQAVLARRGKAELREQAQQFKDRFK
jgi:hypothetical protein